MQKIDIKKQIRYLPLYQPSGSQVSLVDVPTMNFLMVDGAGDPNTSKEYADAVSALFAVAYTIKFMVKKSDIETDYGVMPLEGLWWAEDMTKFSVEDKSNWLWTMMIMQPDFVSAAMARNAMDDVTKKKKAAAISKVRFEAFTEGKCAQIMHFGPFSEEGPKIQRVHEFIETQGKLSGKHHEIYLSDIGKTHPSRWRTIIRQPMK
jgi:hypothetical protein